VGAAVGACDDHTAADGQQTRQHHDPRSAHQQPWNAGSILGPWGREGVSESLGKPLGMAGHDQTQRHEHSRDDQHAPPCSPPEARRRSNNANEDEHEEEQHNAQFTRHNGIPKNMERAGQGLSDVIPVEHTDETTAETPNPKQPDPPGARDAAGDGRWDVIGHRPSKQSNGRRRDGLEYTHVRHAWE